MHISWGWAFASLLSEKTLAQEAVSLNPGTGNWMDNFLHLFVVKISLLFESPKVTKIGP